MLRSFRIFGALLVLVLLTACPGRQYVRMDGQKLQGFQFFLFARLGEETVQANGDAYWIEGESFQFRLYDNLLNKYILTFSSRSNGQQYLVLPLEKSLLSREDTELSYILVNMLFDIINGELINSQNNDTIKDIIWNQGLVQTVVFGYGGQDMRIEILRWLDDGRPGRFKLMSGEEYLIFDIVRYQQLGFSLGSLEGYSRYLVPGDKPFLKWIGEVYGGH